MKKPASLAEAAAIAQFRLAIIAPVIHELYPDSSRNAYYERITEKPFTLPDGSTVRYSPNTISGWVSKYQRGGIDALMPTERSDKGATQNARTRAPPARSLIRPLRRFTGSSRHFPASTPPRSTASSSRIPLSPPR